MRSSLLAPSRINKRLGVLDNRGVSIEERLTGKYPLAGFKNNHPTWNVGDSLQSLIWICVTIPLRILLVY